jgi:hypothetical protein
MIMVQMMMVSEAGGKEPPGCEVSVYGNSGSAITCVEHGDERETKRGFEAEVSAQIWWPISTRFDEE